MTSLNATANSTAVSTCIIQTSSKEGRELAWLVQANYFYEITHPDLKEAEALKIKEAAAVNRQTSSGFFMRSVLKDCGSGDNNLLATQFTKFLNGKASTAACDTKIEGCLDSTLVSIKKNQSRKSEEFRKSGIMDETLTRAQAGLKKSFQSYSASYTSIDKALSEVLPSKGIVPEITKIIAIYTTDFQSCFPRIYQLSKLVFDHCYPFTCQYIIKKAIQSLEGDKRKMIDKISIRIEGLFQSYCLVTLYALRGKIITVQMIKQLRDRVLGDSSTKATLFELTNSSLQTLQEPEWDRPRSLQIEASQVVNQLTKRLGYFNFGD